MSHIYQWFGSLSPHAFAAIMVGCAIGGVLVPVGLFVVFWMNLTSGDTDRDEAECRLLNEWAREKQCWRRRKHA